MTDKIASAEILALFIETFEINQATFNKDKKDQARNATVPRYDMGCVRFPRQECNDTKDMNEGESYRIIHTLL